MNNRIQEGASELPVGLQKSIIAGPTYYPIITFDLDIHFSVVGAVYL